MRNVEASLFDQVDVLIALLTLGYATSNFGYDCMIRQWERDDRPMDKKTPIPP